MRPIASRVAFLATMGLCACAGPRPPVGDDAPTLAALRGREVAVETGRKLRTDEARAIAAYQEFLKAAPRSSLRPEAMRRLGDLEMDRADQQIAEGRAGSGGAADYGAAIARYRAYLQTYPDDPGNDRVFYQLARAYEQGGDLPTALKTLDDLVQRYPKTRHYQEVQFRRGELLFTLRDYARAEQAYASLFERYEATPYHERALYMHGWSLFKQGRLDEALRSFFGVLDVRLGRRGPNAQGGIGLDTIPGLTRAERELVEDTFRVTSLCLENLQGAASIPAYIDSGERRAYEFRVYEQLGELYIKQERIKDAADVFGAFARRDPLHPQAPLLQARVIDLYQEQGFASLALQAKKDYVVHYGPGSEFSRANPQAWKDVRPLVKTRLAELARHFHAGAQKKGGADEYREAVVWYRRYLEAFPDDADTARTRFLLAELLYEAARFEPARFAEAAKEYETTAYHYPLHEKSADAGYAALLAYAQQEQHGGDVRHLRTEAVASALRFAQTFRTDPRATAVLTDAADKLYGLGEPARAAEVAEQVLTHVPPASEAQRRVAGTVIAHAAFDRGDFDRAERAYAEVLALVPANDPTRAELSERAAAAVYKQGEQARARGRLTEAVDRFERVAALAPRSAVRAHADYDAAAARIALGDWAGATRQLAEFRRAYPGHALQADVTDKLALAYLEQGRWGEAAGEFERIGAAKTDAALARAAYWQAAELHEKAGARAAAAAAYESFLARTPEADDAAFEARSRLARLAEAQGQPAKALIWMNRIVQADRTAGGTRSERRRGIAATAALAVAETSVDAYRKVALVEPLQKQLKLKKARMEDALAAYGAAGAYGVAEVTTAATYRTAELYRDFAQALLASERPRRLSKADREQYDVMLEEQAFPFEEKAIEFHETNARRAGTGLYDRWVRESYAALARLRPLRYGKAERGGEAVTGAAASGAAAASAAGQASEFNRRGIAHRRAGEFVQARAAYEQALALDPGNADACLNLGILHDLYLWDGAAALTYYERYPSLSPGGDATVGKWIVDLKNRLARTAAASGGKEGK